MCVECGVQVSRIFWKCICDCGNETSAKGFILTSGHKKSCGCLWEKEYLPHGQSELRARMRSYKAGAKKRKIEWCLTSDQFASIGTSRCYYCGMAPPYRKFREDKGRWGMPWNGVDRVDSSGPYSPSNCVPCCSLCNGMKGTLTAKEYIYKCRSVANNFRKERTNHKCESMQLWLEVEQMDQGSEVLSL